MTGGGQGWSKTRRLSALNAVFDELRRTAAAPKPVQMKPKRPVKTETSGLPRSLAEQLELWRQTKGAGNG